MKSIKAFRTDRLFVNIFENTSDLGMAAAEYVQQQIMDTVGQKGFAHIIIATGASQFSFYEKLKELSGIPWEKITIYHLDEYARMPESHPASFRKYLKERFLIDIQPREVHFIQGDANDLEKETFRYENLLKQVDIDIACIGIGENGHIAFNDPPVADFNDSRLVRIVELDQDCRKQQLGEGWFNSLEEVPSHAISLTVPAIMRARVISCVVPEERKAKAVYDTVRGPVSTQCPASILRRHNNATLFLDAASANFL